MRFRLVRSWQCCRSSKRCRLDGPDGSWWFPRRLLPVKRWLERSSQANIGVLYFPLDWRFAVRKSLDTLQPSLVLIAETEVWPNFLRECGERSIPVLLVNGRLSDRSVSRYRKIKPFMRRVLKNLSFCCMQTELDRDRLLSLGADPAKVEAAGNLKYEIAAP